MRRELKRRDPDPCLLEREEERRNTQALVVALWRTARCDRELFRGELVAGRAEYVELRCGHRGECGRLLGERSGQRFEDRARRRRPSIFYLRKGVALAAVAAE